MPIKITLSPELETQLREESSKLGQDVNKFASDLLTALLSTQPRVTRTERGLTIAGTRITLYDVMDYLTAGYPAQVISEKLNISDRQTQEALDYIKKHHSEVVHEYSKVLEESEEIRQYWQDRNRDHFANIQTSPPKPGTDAIWQKLQAWQSRLEKQI